MTNNKKIKFIIFTPSYNENSGGIIVLHYLCHLINMSNLNVEAYITPLYRNRTLEKSLIKNLKSYHGLLKEHLKNKFKFKTNNNFNTPIFNNVISNDDIVVYPEITFGNPLHASKIIRWLLHKPGYHTKDIYYGLNEFYVKFSEGLVNNFDIEGSFLSENKLYTPYFPLDLYNLIGISKNRRGCAYSIRKGKNKTQDQHPKDAICIDG